MMRQRCAEHRWLIMDLPVSSHSVGAALKTLSSASSDATTLLASVLLEYYFAWVKRCCASPKGALEAETGTSF